MLRWYKKISSDLWQKRMADFGFFLLVILVVVNPFAHTTTLKQSCFYVAVLLWGLLFLGKGRAWLPPATPLAAPTLIFTLLAIGGTGWALNHANTLHDVAAHLVKYIVLYLLFRSFVNDLSKVRLLALLFVVAVLFFCAYGVVDFYLLENRTIGSRFLSGATEMTTNLIGIPILVGIHLAMIRYCGATTPWLKGLLLGTIGFLTMVPLLTRTRSTLLVLALSLLFWAGLLRKRVFLTVFLLFAVAFVFSPAKNRFKGDFTKDVRITHALLVMEVIRDHPLTGIGFGMQTFAELDLPHYRHRIEARYGLPYGAKKIVADPHNMYMDIAVRTGIPGLLAFAWFIVALGSMICSAWRWSHPAERIWVEGTAGALGSFFIVGIFEPVFNHMQEFILSFLFFLISFFWHRAKGAEASPSSNSRIQQSLGPGEGVCH